MKKVSVYASALRVFLFACVVFAGCENVLKTEDEDSDTKAPEIDVRQNGVSIVSGTGSRSFGTVAAGASADLVFSVGNTGGAVLSLTGTPRVALSGTDAAAFSVTNQPAQASVAAGGSVPFTLRFSPPAAGSKTATVTIPNDDANEGTYTFTVTGLASGAAGTLVASYGTDGLRTNAIGTGHNEILDFAIQGDGKIVAAVSAVMAGSNAELVVARFNADGSLDASFGTGGVAYAEVEAGFDFQNNAHAVVLQPDGKIVVVGSNNDITSDSDIALARFNADGSLDAGFGTGGLVAYDLGTGQNYFGVDAALQTGGKIVVLGNVYNGTGNDIVVCRFTSAGVVDASFNSSGTPGYSIVRTGFNDGARAVAVQSDDKILVTGSFSDGFQNSVLIRMESSGVLDVGFGENSDGIVEWNPSTGTDAEAFALALQPDGKILAAGGSYNSGPGDFVLLRYTSEGLLDPSFGGGAGFVITDTGSADEHSFSVALQPDGKILSAGYSYQSTKNYFALFRYTSAGLPDSSFGTGGAGLVSYASGGALINKIAVLTDGTILGAGLVDDGISGDTVLVKFWP